jgi:ABC-type dipeptide/oligopeptide/nickel transport system permease subunit
MADPRTLQRFKRNRGARIGVALVGMVALLATVGPLLAPHPPNEQFPEGLARYGLPRTPDATFWLGTDTLGRDELSRLLHGGAVSLQVALLATALALSIGLLVGVCCGYFGGLFDAIGMRGVDVLLSLPFLLIAIAVFRAVGNPGLGSLSVLLGALSWPSLARVTRAKVMELRERDFVQAARALGASTPRVLFTHVLPNVLGPAVVLGTTMIAEMIIVESAMSFLGLGVQPPQASWGSMLHDGRDMIAHAPHLLLAPGALIAMTVFGFNLLGEGLRDAFDPKA